jgi:hypothetical protein
MSVAATLSYRHIRNTALPFVTASAPTSTNPQYVDGLNILTSYKGYVERRPGFGVNTWEDTPTQFTGTIQRIFGWRLWGSTFFLMLNEVIPGDSSTTGFSNVYKLALGVDSTFQLIWTSNSTNIFDFVVSNNYCFFGNGLDMKKFDGVTVTNWGISVGSIAASAAKFAGTGADGGGSNAWVNPPNIVGAPNGSYATLSLSAAAGTTTIGNAIQATSYGFNASGTITGIQIVLTAFQNMTLNTNQAQCSFQLIYNGNPIGVVKFSNIRTGGAFTTILGSSSDLWGISPSPTIINDATFGIQIIPRCGKEAGAAQPTAATFFFDCCQISIWYLGGISVSVSGTVGTFGASNGGYSYVQCYVTTSGNVSSPTPASAYTGNFSTKLGVNVTLVASTDPQVINIRLFRTTDGGGGVFFEVQGSPYPNVSGVVVDNTSDANLSVITAPTFGFNDPPPPQQGFVWFANRIWGFQNNTVYFTDWEELNIGVAEECSVSGPAGNFWKFDGEVTALSVAQDGVIIYTAGSIYKIDGDSLDTFRRTTVAHGLGCRNRATIARLGAMTAFLANTNSIWTTDTNSLQELSQVIQPTLDDIDHTQADMTFHIQGQERWLVLCDAGHNQTLAYDTNTNQWMPPWSVVGTSLASVETSPGDWQLFLAQEGTNTLLEMTPNAYLDNGVAYPAMLKTNPQPIINEHLGQGSAYIDLYYPQNPGQIAYMEYFGADFNAILPSDVLYEFDDDPATAEYKSILSQMKDAPLKPQGVNVKNMWYYARQGEGRRISLQVTWWNRNENFKLYTMTLAYRITR